MLEKLGLDYRPFSSHTKKRRQMANVDFLLRCLFAWKKYVCTERSLLLILVGGLLAFSPPAFWELLQCLTLWSAVVEFCYYIFRITKSWKWLGNFPPKHQGEENPGWKSGRQGVTSVCADQELTLSEWLSNCQIRITFHRRQFQVEKGESRDLLQIIIKEDNSTYSLNRSVCIFMVWYFIRRHFLLIAALQIWNDV